MGCQKSKILFRGLIEIYRSCYNLFFQFLYYREENEQLKRLYLLSMLSCGALEKSNNSYIEPIVEPCVSKNQKEIFGMWVWIGKENPEKGLRQ